VAEPQLEALPNDGAAWPCSFGTFVEGEEWNCPRPSAGLLSAEVVASYEAEIADFGGAIFVSGRAVCSVHAQGMTETVEQRWEH
jgi:hypothetical protein